MELELLFIGRCVCQEKTVCPFYVIIIMNYCSLWALLHGTLSVQEADMFDMDCRIKMSKETAMGNNRGYLDLIPANSHDTEMSFVLTQID